MILESLCALARRDDLLKNPDYEPKAVAGIIVLGKNGRFIDYVPSAGVDERGKKFRGKVLHIPRRLGRTSAAVADFLIDKSEYVLGIEPDGMRDDAELQTRRELFAKSMREALLATQSPALEAVVDFLSSDEERGRAAERVTAAGYASNDLFAFECEGRLVHELPAVQEYFSRTRRSATEDGVQCLICGTVATAVDKHPGIKVPGGSTSGVALVSFNSDAFESYGLSRNGNAPVCRNCADAYTTALNRLLSDRYPDPRHAGETLPRRFVRLSPDTTAVFWAEREATVLDLLTSFFDAPLPETVAELFHSPHKGRMPPSISNQFYCLILSGGQGRAIIRGMHRGTVAAIEENLRQYFACIETGAERPLPLRGLLESLVLQGKMENLPPSLASDVFWAALFGTRFPETLLARAVGRSRAEREVSRERASLVRAYLVRNLNMEVTVGLDRENVRPGYRLGRLMAVLERVQGAAQRNPNKTIVDRYYGAASTRPATVFPRLISLAQHHIARLKEGAQTFYQKLLGEVIDGLEPPFQAVLSLEEQGLFALGYYHQRQEFFRKAEDQAPTEDEKTDSEEDA